MKRDYYEILGLGRDCTDEDIKKSFRKLAFAYHPDHNHQDGATDKFKEINEAYEVLSDPDKRAAYDRFGHGSDQAFYGRGFEGVDFGGFGEIFDAFFGGATAANRRAPQRGADMHSRAAITFEEAAFGCKKEINISRTEFCSLCQGTGTKPGGRPARCSNCNGTGQVSRLQQNIFGRFISTAVCGKCHGEGEIITEPCPQCRGTGREKRHRSISVNIPAGVDNDNQIRLSGEGHVGMRGGPAGDFYIDISVSPHELFRRDGDDISYELKINFAQAALGAEVEIPTLEGKTKLKLPAGTQTGKIFTLKGKGIPHIHSGGRGDQVIAVVVATPDSLSKKQRQLFEELADTL